MSTHESRTTRTIAAALLGAALAVACGGLAADGELPEAVTRFDRKLAAIVADLQSMPASERRFARYLLLAEHDDGAFIYLAPEEREPTAAERARVRERVLARERGETNSLVNGLSTAEHVSLPRALDADEYILRIDLRDYAWARPVGVAGSTHVDGWEAIASAALLPLDLAGPHADRIRDLTRTSRPLMFVNDLLATGAQTELYYGLLGVPDTLGALKARLVSGVLAEAAEPDTTKPYRAGILISQVTSTMRGIERRVSTRDASRGYWQAFDFLDDERGSAVFNDPLDFSPDGTQVMFTLPNGLYGYYLADAAGARTTEYGRFGVEPSVGGDDGQPPDVASCFACHSVGALGFQDRVRLRYMIDDTDVAPSERDAILETYPSEKVMSRLFADANAAYARAAAPLRDSLAAAGGEGPYSSSLYGMLSPELAADLAFASIDELSAALPQTSLAGVQGFEVGVDARPYRRAYAELFCALQREALNQLTSCR